MIKVNPTLMSINAPVMKNTEDQGKESERIKASEPGISPEIRYALTWIELPKPSSWSGRIWRRYASIEISCVALRNAMNMQTYATDQRLSCGFMEPSTHMQINRVSWVRNIQLRLMPSFKPKKDREYRSSAGAQKISTCREGRSVQKDRFLRVPRPRYVAKQELKLLIDTTASQKKNRWRHK